jgi:acylphosphatase
MASCSERETPTLTRVHLRIFGQVQGVNFRYFARQRAQLLGLSGWIRNRPDGSVEAVVQGSEDAVREFVAWAHHGPSLARVERVEVTPEPPSEMVQTFRILH